ncbi:class III aminotransferase [Marinomonas sp. 42_23_T18]|nr:class III aminotransferase [Marinomonas sp. 42_23_T18]
MRTDAKKTVTNLEQACMVIVAPNGARKNKLDHPALPITPDEIAEDVAQCVAAGASMVHLHARTESGRHSLEVDDNRMVMAAVKERMGDDVVIQLTTEAVGIYQPEQQMHLIRTLKPEAASFALSELIPDPSHEAQASEFFHWVAQEGIIAQYIVYSAEQLAYYLDLRERRLLPANKHHLLLVLGRYHKVQESEPSDLKPFIHLIEQLDKIRWAVCAFGKKEQDCLVAAAELGGDLRIGFENNLFTHSGELAKNNAAQVAGMITRLQQIERVAISTKQLRDQF